METSGLMPSRPRERLNRIESRGRLGRMSESLGILKTLDQLGDVASELRREPTRAPMSDCIDHLRRTAAKVDRFAGADEVGATPAGGRIFDPAVPLLFM